MGVPDMLALEELLAQSTNPARKWLELPTIERDPSQLATLLGMVEQSTSTLVAVKASLPTPEYLRMRLPLRHLQEALARIQQQEPIPLPDVYVADTQLTGYRGRPPSIIEDDKLQHLLRTRMTYKDIGRVLGVSYKTVMRRAKQLGMAKRTYDDISREELVAEVKAAYERGSGGQGYRSIQAQLEGRGIKAKRDQIASICREVDPEGSRQRYTNTKMRRMYKVPWINYVWHIDGHHKLNPFGFVIHGAIDGYSRRIMFMGVSNNNRASTVARLFEAAVLEHGWPSRVRVDHGKENLDIKTRMEEVLGVEDRHGVFS